MHSNDVRLVRVYAREEEGKIIGDAFSHDNKIEMVVEARAGITIFGDGAKYQIQFIVRDLSDFTIGWKARLKGHFGDELWQNPVLSHAFTIHEQCPFKGGHVYDMLASLAVGITNPNVSFVTSPMFIIY